MESEIDDLSFAACADERFLIVFESRSGVVVGEDIFASRCIFTQPL